MASFQRLLMVVCALLYALFGAVASHAQSSSDLIEPVTGSGLPGLWRTVSPKPRDPNIQISGQAEYGFTEAHSTAPGEHHRLGLQLSLAARPVSWFAASATTRFRHDRHVSDAQGNDQGTTVDSLLALQLGTSASPQVHWGVLLQGRFGEAADIGVSLSNPTADALLLGEYQPQNAAYELLTQLGYRLDLSGNAVGAPDRYRSGDRLALGVSDFDAIVFNVGGRYHWGATSAMLELGGALLVGNGAPEVLQSPWWLSLGVHRPINRTFSWSLVVDGSLGDRRPAQSLPTHVPVASRIRLLAGLSMLFGKAPPEVQRPPSTIEVPAIETVAPKTALEVHVTSPEGDPLSDAQVYLIRKGKRWQVSHVNLERYRVENIDSGPVTLHVTADRLRSEKRTVQLGGGQVVVKVQLQPSGVTGQIRGVVRSFSGGGLLTRIRIEPLGEKKVTSASGRFEIDVPPGHYEVVLEAKGYQSQRRTVRVTANGVVILNADLRRGSP